MPFYLRAFLDSFFPPNNVLTYEEFESFNGSLQLLEFWVTRLLKALLDNYKNTKLYALECVYSSQIISSSSLCLKSRENLQFIFQQLCLSTSSSSFSSSSSEEVIDRRSRLEMPIAIWMNELSKEFLSFPLATLLFLSSLEHNDGRRRRMRRKTLRLSELVNTCSSFMASSDSVEGQVEFLLQRMRNETTDVGNNARALFQILLLGKVILFFRSNYLSLLSFFFFLSYSPSFFVSLCGFSFSSVFLHLVLSFAYP